MRHSITHVALVVRDYDEAIGFYCGVLGFDLLEDTYQPVQDKRWVVVRPKGGQGASIVLARASKPEQEHRALARLRYEPDVAAVQALTR